MPYLPSQIRDWATLAPTSPTPYLIGVGALAIPAVYGLYRALDPFMKSIIFGKTMDLADWYNLTFPRPAIFRGDGRSHFVKRLLEGSIIDQDGAEHARTRRLLAPAFKLDILRSYHPRILGLIDSDFQYWVQKSAKNGFVDMELEIKQLTLRIAFNLLIGADISTEDKEVGSELIKRYNGIFQGFLPWPLGEWNGRHRGAEAKRNVIADVTEIIRKRVADLDIGKEPANSDPLWLLIKQAQHENGDRLSVEELAHHALLLVIAGHETTAATVAAFIVKGLEHPEIVTRMRAEQDALFADGGCVLPTDEDLKHMPYTDAVFREVERMYPPAMQVQRRAKKDLLFNIEGEKPAMIKKGELIMWDVGATNRDPKLYTNPNTFNPDRWLSPEISFAEDRDNASDLGAQKTSNFKLATFGAGHRVCLGMQFARMEMLVMGCLLMRDYEMEAVEPHKWVKSAKPAVGWGGIKVRYARRP
ncbi:hypothetical protein HK097_004374 [Rhizophlyctis rosea]|uniref:Cytochrome P450 n=1 Tax=Rhizophlyctis rosea TaxID=64517 RepID=A0AAD5X768_9FUNG|nr:hypothetical protein HK097_004374 [Rhizophlyctis rosea]